MFQLELLATYPGYAFMFTAYRNTIYTMRFIKRVALISAVLFVALVTLSTLCIVYLYNRFEDALVYTASVGSDAYNWYDKRVIRSRDEWKADGIHATTAFVTFTAPDLSTLSWNRLRSMCKVMGVKVKTKVQALAELRSMPDYAVYSAHLLTTH
ncbi:hypothetical protein LPP2_g01 [Leptolyngbya phage LPP-2, strain SPI]|uniref:Uncharacterized protein n=1 Tax=Leptolyngbya phage LPP-2, strain SPI TaxID=2996053 RepID=A0AAE9PS87_9CAUD|nr:hypothetical protein LPP2_g01 [Leptolyngbya phage LPP-2 st. SPI]